MTETTVRNVFAKYISGDSLTIDVNEWVNVSIFTTLFSSAADPPTYTQLASIDNGTMGYGAFFNRAKADDAIN